MPRKPLIGVSGFCVYNGNFPDCLFRRKITNLLSRIEMLVVLLIISVLLLLFVPNLTKQKDSVKETGNAAVVKVVESQAELYELNHTNDQATLAKLIADGNITNKQAESYRAYYAKNSGETRAVAD